MAFFSLHLSEPQPLENWSQTCTDSSELFSFPLNYTNSDLQNDLLTWGIVCGHEEQNQHAHTEVTPSNPLQ